MKDRPTTPMDRRYVVKSGRKYFELDDIHGDPQWVHAQKDASKIANRTSARVLAAMVNGRVVRLVPRKARHAA